MTNTDLAKMLGAYFCARRKALNVTQKALKDSLGFSAQFLGHIEKGKAMIPDAAFTKIISALSLEKEEVRKIYYQAVDRYIDQLFDRSHSENFEKKKQVS